MTTVEVSGVVENLHTHRETPWAEKGEYAVTVTKEETSKVTTDSNPEGFVAANAKGTQRQYARGRKEVKEKTRPFYRFLRDADGKPYMPKEAFEWSLWQKFMEVTGLSKWDGPKGRATTFEVESLEFGDLLSPTTIRGSETSNVYKNRAVPNDVANGPTTLTVGLKRDQGMQYQVFERMDYVKFTAKVHTPFDEAKATSYLEAMNEWRFGPTNRGKITIEVL